MVSANHLEITDAVIAYIIALDYFMRSLCMRVRA